MMHISEGIDFQISHFRTFQTSVTLTLDDMAYRRVSLIDLYLQTKFCFNQTFCGLTDVQTDTETSFIRS